MDPFESFLEENRDKKTILVTPGGNHGDTLIHMGHIKKLKEYGYEYECFNLDEKYSRNPVLGVKYLVNIALWKLGSKKGFKIVDIPQNIDLILFEGGGYVNDVWFGPTLLNQVLKRNQQVVAVAPQSYRFNEPSIETHDDSRKLYLFCRENGSFKHLKQMDLADNIQVETSPEVALYLTREDLVQHISPRDEGYQLVAFRGDKESAISNELKKEVLSLCSNPMQSDISVKGTLSEFISSVEYAEKIFTDRLHVAILGSILGKDVTMFGNMYHKNRGVWEYSLSDKVTFITV
jgi:exopolysaccharide biosynthesis predicted pyruvyltransferase EpsI